MQARALFFGSPVMYNFAYLPPGRVEQRGNPDLNVSLDRYALMNGACRIDHAYISVLTEICMGVTMHFKDHIYST